ncbi:TetR/AcrR family transcriptional regulator [Nocardia sp. NBC_00881]|uniref:TetR/AcrR family transcriptional regulator n=1 Tax=Nocardia sp. NBC_00881 TaxID=2975995 RepID=UPI0038707589|nr:TetR/AcrR family transcriptional regulator [Nocardia sp. NBC_00881]
MADPRPSVASHGAASTRDRLLDAAARLFYEQGVHIGVDTLCKAAGVSKRSMYQLFSSKDELLAASLERIAPNHQAALLPADDVGSPRERILHVFERLEYLEPVQDFRGCPYVAAAVQLKSPEHPASQVARRQKDGLTSFFRDEAERGGAYDPAQLARQLTLVFDGASAQSVIQAQQLDGLAVATASTLLDAAGVGKPLPNKVIGQAATAANAPAQ